jgi:hypothetical protein
MASVIQAEAPEKIFQKKAYFRATYAVSRRLQGAAHHNTGLSTRTFREPVLFHL